MAEPIVTSFERAVKSDMLCATCASGRKHPFHPWTECPGPTKERVGDIGPVPYAIAGGKLR